MRGEVSWLRRPPGYLKLRVRCASVISPWTGTEYENNIKKRISWGYFPAAVPTQPYQLKGFDCYINTSLLPQMFPPYHETTNCNYSKKLWIFSKLKEDLELCHVCLISRSEKLVKFWRRFMMCPYMCRNRTFRCLQAPRLWTPCSE